MLLTEKFYQDASEVWESFHDHPFVKGLGDGTLEEESFRFYMIQDYLYLLEYVKVFALGLTKSKDEFLQRKFAAHIHNTLNVEMDIHKAYMARLGITPDEVAAAKPSIHNQAYTSYMIDAASTGDALDALTAILACAWSYAAIAAEMLNRNPGARDHQFYGEWVQGYTSEAFVSAAEDLIALTNQYGAEVSDQRAEALSLLFTNCCRFEYGFWDMALLREM